MISLKDKTIFNFVLFYLCRRYQNLTFEYLPEYSDIKSYISDLLIELQSDVLKTKAKYFNSLTRPAFQQIHQQTLAKNFDFDARVFLEILNGLPDNARILDFGAGNNNFLPAMANKIPLKELVFYATDFIKYSKEPLDKGPVKFVTQNNPYRAPDIGPFDLILLRRVAHHIVKIDEVIVNLTDQLKDNGYLVFIEDTYDDQNDKICPETIPFVDVELTQKFYKDLNENQKVDFLKFNDYYANFIFHDWETMPLPLNHKPFSEWINLLNSSGLKPDKKFNMGFPRNIYNLHQSSTGILCWKKQ